MAAIRQSGFLLNSLLAREWQPGAKESLMKKASKGMRPEYDFSGGVCGKYTASFPKGTNVVVLEPDVAEFFSNSAAVNDALRVLVQIAKRNRKPKRQGTKAL